MSFSVDFMFVCLKEAVKYVPVTLLLAFVPLLVGLVFGTLIALVRLFRIRVLSGIAQGFIVIFKGTPVVLLVLMTYFLYLQYFDGIAGGLGWTVRSKDINPICVAFAALSVFAVVNLSEAMRGALLSVERGQFEAGYSIGLTKAQTLKRIILPQALPVAVPMLGNGLIGLVKGSSLAFLMAVTDLLNAALIPANANYRFLEAYIAAGIVYWVICLSIERLSAVIEKKLGYFVRKAIV
jgi:L-cystine transport system permease protein